MQNARPIGPPTKNGRRPHLSDPAPATNEAMPQAMEVMAIRFATTGKLVARSWAMTSRNGARVVPLLDAANMARQAAISRGQGMWRSWIEGAGIIGR